MIICTWDVAITFVNLAAYVPRDMWRRKEPVFSPVVARAILTEKVTVKATLLKRIVIRGKVF